MYLYTYLYTVFCFQVKDVQIFHGKIQPVGPTQTEGKLKLITFDVMEILARGKGLFCITFHPLQHIKKKESL